MTYSKHDRVTVELDGEVRTMTIIKLLISTDQYHAVTASGKSTILNGGDIKGLA